MKIEFKTEKPKYNDLINNFILILAGVFLSTVVASLIIKILPSYGVYLALLTLSALIFSGFKYIEKDSKFRLIIWGVVTTLILTVVFSAIFLVLVNTKLNFN